jgi:Mitochondrial carrier protein
LTYLVIDLTNASLLTIIVKKDKGDDLFIATQSQRHYTSPKFAPLTVMQSSLSTDTRRKRVQLAPRPSNRTYHGLPAKSTVTATGHGAVEIHRTRPAFEKLIIGPCMVLGEMVTGGHYLEVLRVGKQLSAVAPHSAGHAHSFALVKATASASYYQIHRGLVQESGLLGAFYRGFWPWGLLQCAKGVPVLFIQHESLYQLRKNSLTQSWSSRTLERLSGCLGGCAQAILVTPLQKLKVMVVARHDLANMTPLQAVQQVLRDRQGSLMSLWDGLGPMVFRRSLDWGIRFGVYSEVRNYLVEYRRDQREQQQKYQRQSTHATLQSSYILARRDTTNAISNDNKLPWTDHLICGMLGGAASAITHPVDNIITQCQKPTPPGVPHDVASVVRRMYAESGVRAFTRAWTMTLIDNAYHMAWMYGVGTVLYEAMAQALC